MPKVSKKKNQDNQNPAGNVKKPKGLKGTPGMSDDTRVIYAEEPNSEDG